jgi:hypothetical protein
MKFTLEIDLDDVTATATNVTATNVTKPHAVEEPPWVVDGTKASFQQFSDENAASIVGDNLVIDHVVAGDEYNIDATFSIPKHVLLALLGSAGWVADAWIVTASGDVRIFCPQKTTKPTPGDLEPCRRWGVWSIDVFDGTEKWFVFENERWSGTETTAKEVASVLTYTTPATKTKRFEARPLP